MTIHVAAPRTAALLVLSALAVSCMAENDAPAADTGSGIPAGLPADHPPISASPTAGAATAPVGVVLEQMDGGGYTYARVQIEGEEIWAAGPLTLLAEGDTVALVDVFPMQDFESSALGRTFDVLYFVGGYEAAQPAPSPMGVVLQVLHSGGYTYLEVDVDGAGTWIAAPGTQVAQGDYVAWQGGMVMRGFTSGSLNRTFDEILFVERVEVIE